MKQVELMMFYDYFLSRIGNLENCYIQINNNMRTKSYRYCDELDFLELMLIKNELDYTVQIFNELKLLLKL